MDPLLWTVVSIKVLPWRVRLPSISITAFEDVKLPLVVIFAALNTWVPVVLTAFKFVLFAATLTVVKTWVLPTRPPKVTLFEEVIFKDLAPTVVLSIVLFAVMFEPVSTVFAPKVIGPL